MKVPFTFIREFFSPVGGNWKGVALILVVLIVGLSSIGFAARPAILNHIADVNALKAAGAARDQEIAVIMTKLQDCYRGKEALERRQKQDTAAMMAELAEIKRTLNAAKP